MKIWSLELNSRLVQASGHHRTYIRIAHFPKSGSPYPLSGEVITLDSIRCGRIGKSSDSERGELVYFFLFDFFFDSSLIGSFIFPFLFLSH